MRQFAIATCLVLSLAGWVVLAALASAAAGSPNRALAVALAMRQ